MEKSDIISATEDTPIGRFSPRMLPGQEFEDSHLETWASSSYQTAASWLKRCLTDHPNCPGNKETLLPRRLIFVGNGHENPPG